MRVIRRVMMYMLRIGREDTQQTGKDLLVETYPTRVAVKVSFEY